MNLLYYLLFSVVVVGLDQFTKYLTLVNIPLHTEIPFIPGFLGFTYVRNYGAAFSSLQGQQWLFVLIFAVLTVAIVWEYFKNSMKFSKFEWWCIVSIYAGGLGNMIDRVRLGYVVDMIQTKFMDFPVFNVADCFITCGCFAMMFSLFFLNKAFWKEDKK